MSAVEPIKQSAWMAKSNFNFAKNNKATVRISEVVDIASDAVLKVMSTTFEPLSRDAHYITVASRIILADRVSQKIYKEEEVFSAEQKIAEHFARVNEYFDRRIAQANQKIELAGFDPQGVKLRTQAYEAECTTRTATDYLDILKKADIYLGLNDFLWIKQLLSDNQLEALRAKLNNEREVRQQLLSIPRKTTAQFQLIHRICQGVMTDRRAASAEQSARDKKKHAEALRAKTLAVAQVELDAVAGLDGNAQPGAAETGAAA